MIDGLQGVEVVGLEVKADDRDGTDGGQIGHRRTLINYKSIKQFRSND